MQRLKSRTSRTPGSVKSPETT